LAQFSVSIFGFSLKLEFSRSSNMAFQETTKSHPIRREVGDGAKSLASTDQRPASGFSRAYQGFNKMIRDAEDRIAHPTLIERICGLRR
jgi:hypothetical protein